MEPHILTQTTPEIQPVVPPQPEIVKAPEGHSGNLIKFILLTLVILIIIVISGGAYVLNKNSVGESLPSPMPTISSIKTPSITSAPIATPNSVVNNPIGENTVSFAMIDGKAILQYHGKFYDVDDSIYSPTPLTISNLNSYPWKGLVDRPESKDAYYIDEIFSFKSLPNKLGFVFVMRWETEQKNTPTASNPSSGAIIPNYKVFYYDAIKNKLFNSLTFEPNSSQYSVPKIDKISSEGKFISFNMFGCWNCGGHKPETLLLNLETNISKRIGKIENFTWGENGNYTYKEYKVIDCAEPGPGQCNEDPTKLPLLRGQF